MMRYVNEIVGIVVITVFGDGSGVTGKYEFH